TITGLLYAAPYATAQKLQPAPPAGRSFVTPMLERPLVPMPELRKRKRPRARLVQPKRKKVKTVKRRRARIAPDAHLRGPQELPWEAEIKRFQERSRILGPDPQARLRIALRRLNADPMLRLGYSANVPQMPHEETPKPVVPPIFEQFSAMDRNGDGDISRGEYMSARTRLLPAGPTGDSRRRSQSARLNSRFRGVDSNKDGRITPEELEGLRNLRF
ncbi:MAG: hypothetical protein ACTSQV_06970, partial [Alphaproteobacteria bacterium]